MGNRCGTGTVVEPAGSSGHGQRYSAREARIAGIHVLWGGILLCAPGRLLQAAGLPNARRRVAVLRILGARHLVEAGVLVRVIPGPVGVLPWVETAHGISMVGLALGSPTWRKAASVSTAIALGFAAESFAAEAHATSRNALQ